MWGSKCDSKEKDAVKQVILDAYRDGIFNVGNLEVIKKGFHPEFNLLMNKEGKLEKLPIAKWMEYVKKKIEAGKYPPKEKVNFKFKFIDVIGNAASVRVEFFKGEKLTYTDFLLLYKFADGWKLVSKIYHKYKS
jgi:hypothetical protein